MICPGKSSLHRKPFITTERPSSRVTGGEGQGAAIRWYRCLCEPLPRHARRIRDALPRGIFAPDPCASKAAGFLTAHARALGISDPSQLRFIRTSQSRSGAHVRFQQMYRTIPVIGALLDVHLDRGGSVCAVEGAYQRHLSEVRQLAATPAVTRREAIGVARDDLGRRCRMRAQPRFYELIYCGPKRPRRVFKVVLPAAMPLGNWVYLIDPYSGSILHSYNTMRFAQGKGRVYLLSPIEDPSLPLVTLERMASPIELRGEHVTVLNDDAPEARSERGIFLYPPDETHFDEVMAYYHIDRVSAFFQSCDPSLRELMSRQGTLRAYVHAGERMDNAYYDPSTNGIYIGDGGGAGRLNDLAKEAAVIYHEYTHAVLDHINPHLKGSQADALHEGYADYFGCSLTDDAQIGEYVVAPTGEPHLRDLTNRKRYPRDCEGEAHADGEIWGGACWDIRSSLGARAADSLVYESMQFLPEFARFTDAARGVAQVDENIFSGRHISRLSAIFSARGMTLSPSGRERCR